MQHAISCIIPVRNGGALLDQTLLSVRAQTVPLAEILVVDDGSTDNTQDIAHGHGATVIRQAPSGPAAARNAGLRNAKGSFIAMMDGDDLWPAEKLAIQMRAFVEYPDTGICMGYARGFTEIDGRIRFSDEKVVGYVMSGLLARREVFDRVGGLNESLRHSDCFEWFLRARKIGVKEHVVPDVILHRRIHHGSMSRLEAVDSKLEHLRTARSFHAAFPQGALQ